MGNDALMYLPRRPLIEYDKDQVIFAGKSESLYLVATGLVKVSTAAADNCEVIIRIVPPEGLFGLHCLSNQKVRERASALDSVQIMAWPRNEVDQQIKKEPRLGLALLEVLLTSQLEVQDRLLAMVAYRTPERVMLSLLQLAQALGKEGPDGAIKMRSLDHHLIAKHVGTSREIVNTQMNHLRQLGLICYTRNETSIYREAMEKSLRARGVELKQ